MWIVITSLICVVLLCLFIILATYVGTVAGIVIVAASCTAMILGSVGLVIGVVAMLVGIHHEDDGPARPKEIRRGFLSLIFRIRGGAYGAQ